MWEYIIIVNVFSLRVAFSYQSGFVVYNITIERSLFLCKYELITDRFLSLRQLWQFQVSFLCRELISSVMASFHILNSELISAFDLLLNDWESIGHYYVSGEPTGLTWISSGSSNCNWFLDITHSLSLILINIISILIGYMIATLCRCGCDLKWYWSV